MAESVTGPQWFATSAQCLEQTTVNELTRLGATDTRIVPGGVYFSGDHRVLYRALLELRTAHRLLKPLREFAAVTAEMLYSQTRRVVWESFLNPERTFAVFATFEQGKGSHGIKQSQFAALKVKDAIVDRLRREQGARPNIDTKHPDVRVHAHFAGGRCALSLDGAGASLHERGYRLAATDAPLRETLAAGMLELTGWDGTVPLYDPFCGSGTIAIEAALQARRIAPGLLRSKFGVELWPDFNRDLWNEVLAETRARVLPQTPTWIGGSDLDVAAIRASEENAERAAALAQSGSLGLKFFPGNAEEVEPPTDTPGIIVVNPPYGERMGTSDEVRRLYLSLSEVWPKRFKGWRAYILVGNLKLARYLEMHAIQKIKLRNGPLECRLLRFDF